MIQKTENRDLYSLSNIYSNLYPGAFVDYWFDEEFDPLNSYIVKDGADAIVASLSARSGGILLEDKNIGYALLSQLYINGEYEKKNMARDMMREVMDELSHQKLIVLAKTEGYEVYKQLGFEPLYTRKTYTISRSQVAQYTAGGIYDQYQEKDLLQAYSQFISFFNGARIRSLKDFEKKRAYHKATGKKVLAYYKGENRCEGYVVYDPLSYPLEVEEFVYLNSTAFLKLMSYLLNIKDSVTLSLTPQEKISKMVPTAVGKEKSDTWAKITDYGLFNRLFNTEISSIRELTEISRKPFYFNEPF